MPMKNEKNIMRLCMKYGASCKLCPRNKKCDEEILIEKKRGESYESKSSRNGIRNNKHRRNK